MTIIVLWIVENVSTEDMNKEARMSIEQSLERSLERMSQSV